MNSPTPDTIKTNHAVTMQAALLTLQNQFQQGLVKQIMPKQLFNSQPNPANSDGRQIADLPTRFGIYTFAFRSRLEEALRDNYPILHKVVGDDAFSEIAHAYLAAHPSQHPSIRWFGHLLSEFLSSHENLIPHPAIVDLVRMEWAVRSAFDGADAPLLNAATLAQLAPEQWADLPLRLHPTAHILSVDWQVEPIWQTLTKDEAAEVTPPAPLVHDMLIWRKELVCYWRSLDNMEARLLESIKMGNTKADVSFGELCAACAWQVGEAGAASTAIQYLQQWLLDQLLVVAPD
ncbi:putative DNA-binding domain-containing protein [Ampullimonas aquatilis]|uniref:HvfC/BufC family peptide modification chaperone n=1 Tax=Ampullimonas aquatilis TaxID=1341549 RepID=UPI003C72FE46